MSQTAEVVVVGGGVNGASIACALAGKTVEGPYPYAVRPDYVDPAA